MKGAIELSDVIEELRTELLVAMKEGDGKELRFGVDSVEVELQVAVTKETEGEAKAKFWVLEVGGKGKLADARTQTVRLTLTPKGKPGADGKPGPVDIAG